MTRPLDLAHIVLRLAVQAQEVLNRPVLHFVNARRWEGSGEPFLRVDLCTAPLSDDERMDAELCLEEWLVETFGAKEIDSLALRINPDDLQEALRTLTAPVSAAVPSPA
jgi:hypothetical protein